MVGTAIGMADGGMKNLANSFMVLMDNVQNEKFYIQKDTSHFPPIVCSTLYEYM